MHGTTKVYGKASTGLIGARTSKYSTIITKRNTPVPPKHPQFIYSFMKVHHPLRTKFRPNVPVTGGSAVEVVWRDGGTARTTPGS